MKSILLASSVVFFSLPAFAGSPFFSAHCQGENGVRFQLSLEGCANQFDMYESDGSRTKQTLALRTQCDGKQIIGVQSFEQGYVSVITDTFINATEDGSNQLSLISTPDKFTKIRSDEYSVYYSFGAKVARVTWANGEKSVKVYPVACQAESFLEY